MTELSADKLAQFISNITFENLPVSVQEQIRWRLLDALSILLSDDKNAVRLASIAVQECSGDKQAGVAIEGRPLSLESAQVALSVGALLEAAPLGDSGTQTFARVNAAIIAAAWSTVESIGGNGRLLMEALAAGYVATAALAERVSDDDTLVRRLGACSATIAAAAAAAKAQGLSAAATLNALGFAVGQATQLSARAQKTSDAAGQPGAARAAMDGVLSAGMAATGSACPAELINLFRQAIDATCSDSWQSALVQQPAPAADQAVQSFRERLSSRIGRDRVDVIIRLIEQLEHTDSGAFTSCVLS